MAIPGRCSPVINRKAGEHKTGKQEGDCITTKIAGKPHTVSLMTNGGVSSARKKTVKDEMTVQVKPQMKAGTHDERTRGIDQKKSPAEAGHEPTVIIHEQEGRDSISPVDCYQKNRGIVHRAMELLKAWKYLPARIVSATLPVDIIALRDDMDMLVQVISSKHPILNVKTLYRNYAKKIDSVRLMGVARRYRLILMAYSMPCGWKHYDVLPGGLMPAWDLHNLPAE